MRKTGIWTVGLLLAGMLALPPSTQAQSSSIQGVIHNSQGEPIAKAMVYLDSPATMAQKFAISSAAGKFRFSLLPPGPYRLMVEKPEHVSQVIENIDLRLGAVIRLRITMDDAVEEETVSSTFSSPILDPESSSTSVVIEEALIEDIPFRRDLPPLLASAPGVLVEDGGYPQSFLINGSSARSNLYSLDGLSINDPTGMYLLSRVNIDVLEEIEIETAGHSIETGDFSGGYVNIITRSGGNSFDYSLLVQHTGEKFTNRLRTYQQIEEAGTAPPAMDRNLWDFSFSLGGALWPDRLWFFGNSRFNHQVRSSPFIPWTDPNGKSHRAFDWKSTDILTFAKLSTNPYAGVSMSGTFTFSDRYQPKNSEFPDWTLSADATRILKHEKMLMAAGDASYEISDTTLVDLKVGYINLRAPFELHKTVSSEPSFVDAVSGRRWGSGLFNETRVEKRFQASAALRHFYGGGRWIDGEVRVGAQYEFINGQRDVWKENNLLVMTDGLSRYFFGSGSSPVTGLTTGVGLVGFSLVPKSAGSMVVVNEVRRLGFFLHNSLTLAGRITVSTGLRFDRSIAHWPSFAKLAASGNDASLAVGDEWIKPILGFNPFTPIFIPDWKNFLIWNTFTPQIGLTIDLFGSGRTLLTASVSRYAEALSLQTLNNLNRYPFDRDFRFTWYDENGDGIVDADDNFLPYPDDYRIFIQDYHVQRLSPDLSAPRTTEFTAGIRHQLMKDFSVGIGFIQKDTRDIIENVLYDPDSQKDWYTTELAEQGWWIPFQTVVPGSAGSADAPVTVYFRSNDAPLLFDRLKNVPELRRRYRGVELTFAKRMSGNWQVAGSLLFSRATGNIGLGSMATSGLTAVADTPNSFVNNATDSRLDFDRPLTAKLMGSYRFPWGFHLSFFYSHLGGTPRARFVSITPPASWAQANNVDPSSVTVLLETPGARRTESRNTLDLRVQKDIRVSTRARLSLTVDVFNLLGDKTTVRLEDDYGLWFPEAENSVSGRQVLSPLFDRPVALQGVRSVLFTLRLGF